MKTFLSQHYTLPLVLALFLASCGKPTSLVILPQDCSLPVSGQIALTLSGQIDPNSRISWQTDFGAVVQNGQGLSANYTAPSVPGAAVITAMVTSGVSATTSTLSVTCKVTDAQPMTPSQEETPAVINTSTPPTGPWTIVISEVMGNPCGDLDQRKYNQYVELYNYGDQPVDVGGWWLYDEGDSGTPDQITSWNTRSSFPISDGLVLNSTVLPPGGVAVVLSPQYPKNSDISKMPYTFPQGVLILTVAESDTLGDDYFGIIADQNGYDTVTLYTGGKTIIGSIVDTYGTPSILSPYPLEIEDDHNDNIPTYLSDCHSIERKDPTQKDEQSNWKSIPDGTPGEVPFYFHN